MTKYCGLAICLTVICSAVMVTGVAAAAEWSSVGQSLARISTPSADDLHAAQPALSPDSVSSIEIYSTFQGLPLPPGEPGGPEDRDDLMIVRSHGKFMIDGHVVPDEKITALVTAISRAPRSVPLHEDFGIRSDWLNATADNAFLQTVYGGRSPGGSGFFNAAQRGMYIAYLKRRLTRPLAMRFSLS